MCVQVRSSTLNIATILHSTTHFAALPAEVRRRRQQLPRSAAPTHPNTRGVACVRLFSNIVAMFIGNMLLVFVAIVFVVVVVHYCLLYLQVQVTEIDA